MRADNFSFKSFYYCLGTTSFRMSNFNLKIERQLALLDEFWKIAENANVKWKGNEIVQCAYYDFLKENKFVEGDAPRKAKDARQKTSGLRDIGLIDDGRRLTDAGKALLEISKSGDFSSDDFLQIPRDSFVYFKQLLKTSIFINDASIRPFILLARLLKNFDYLTFDEFAYLFPLCIDEPTTNFIEKNLQKSRGTKSDIDKTIAEIFMSQENYKNALQYFLSETEITAETFKKIGLNRKSRDYDAAYFPLWRALKKVYFDMATTEKNILELYEKSNLQNVKTHWRKLLFKTSSSVAIKKSPLKHFQTANVFANPNDEKSFKTAFFKTMHLIKIKKTLEDYFDLNRRYLKISDVLTFSDSQVRFDIIPKAYFSQIDEKFFNLAFEKGENLFEDKSLEEISPYLKFNKKNLLQKINDENKSHFSQIGEVKNFVEGEHLKRFNRLIDSKFSDEKIVEILKLFNARKDAEIQSLVTDNADCPTIFEYVLAIAWYKGKTSTICVFQLFREFLASFDFGFVSFRSCGHKARLSQIHFAKIQNLLKTSLKKIVGSCPKSAKDGGMFWLL